MHLKEGVICICFPVQQRLKLFGGGGFHQGFNRGFGIFDHVLVVFHCTKFNQFDAVVQFGLHVVMPLDRINQGLPFTHQFLGIFRIIPQIGIFDTGVEFLKPMFHRFPPHALAQQLKRFVDLIDHVLNVCAHLGSYPF